MVWTGLYTAVLGNLAKNLNVKFCTMRNFSHLKSMAIFVHVQKLTFRFFATFPKTAVVGFTIINDCSVNSHQNFFTADQLEIKFEFYCRDDSESFYQPYGYLTIILMNYGYLNTLYHVKEEDAHDVQYPNGRIVQFYYTFELPYVTSGRDYVSITGLMKEDDNSGEDDIIGDIPFTRIKIGDIWNNKFYRQYKGEHGNWVKVTIN